ncbi:MAG: hypothetical protein MJ114_03640 [Acetatifactor sp.]|nr:hypothetical protein [Acetatifactor sp.]
MKRIFKGIAALSLAATVFATSAVTTNAMNDSYTYNYDYWGDVQASPDFYTVRRVFNHQELGLQDRMKNPQGMFAIGNKLYVCDTGNNRIIEMMAGENESLSVVKTFDSIKGDVEIKELNTPTDIAISEDGNIFIADKGNARILKLDENLNYLMQFDVPVDSTLDPNMIFQPSKIAVDTAERVYCVATGINKGLVKYESDGVFSGFVGAAEVAFDWTDYIWKKFATQAQREKMEDFVPTEYENLYMDYEGFIYVVNGNSSAEDLKAEKAKAVKKLNLMGSDILVQNGEYPVYGDLYMGNGGGHEGPSRFTDVTCLENDIYMCLDRNRGRVFGYDDQGNMMFAFGGNGNMDGYFRYPTAIEHIGHDLYVLDSQDCSITMFVPTDFGNTVYEAIEQFDLGNYDRSGECWQKAMDLNGNYNQAYIGLGRAHLRQEEYGDALEYFELKYDAENYSKAYKQYRKGWVQDNIGIIIVVLLLLILVPNGIGRVKQIKHEIETADIFKVD